MDWKKTDIADIEHIDQILEISETALEDILLPNTIPTEGMENIQSFRSHITEEDIYLNLHVRRTHTLRTSTKEEHETGNRCP